MAVTSDRIESFFETKDLKFYRRIDDGDSTSWLLLFGNQTIITLRLLEDGECLLFRSLPIVNLAEHKLEHQLAVCQHLMERNDGLMVGHYSGSKEVVFEMTLPIEDGDVSDDQLGRVLAVVSNEVIRFGPTLRAIARGESPPDPGDSLGSAGDSSSTSDADRPPVSMDELMDRLCHGQDDPPSESSDPDEDENRQG